MSARTQIDRVSRFNESYRLELTNASASNRYATLHKMSRDMTDFYPAGYNRHFSFEPFHIILLVCRIV